MDGPTQYVLPHDIYLYVGTVRAPLVIDVRCMPAFDSSDMLIAGAIRRSPEDVQSWVAALPRNRPLVAYCRAQLAVAARG